MAAGVLTVEILLPQSTSLKDKRAVLRALLDGSRSRFGVAAAEVDHQDLRQRATISFAAVGASYLRVEQVLDTVERLVWSRPELEVVEARRDWLESS